jgi:hypothetical protein
MKTENSTRIAMFDPIRVILTMVVIIHHVSITYGGSGDWYYREPGAPEWTKTILSILTATDQSYFMGFFFLIAGYLTPASLARKGETAYLGDRMWRLGFPIFIFGYLLQPLSVALGKASGTADFWPILASLFSKNEFGFGPLWFNKALIFFAVIWCFFPALRKLRAPGFIPENFHVRVFLLALLTGLSAFALRLAVPVGQNLLGMQIGYFASYIVLFGAGCCAAESRLLENIGWKKAAPWLVASVLVFPTLWIYAARFGFGGNAVRGGWNTPAILYAMWEPFLAAGVILAILAFFRKSRLSALPLVKRLSDASFITFVIHAPVAVGACRLVSVFGGSHMERFLISAPLACVISFAIGDLLTSAFSRWRTFRAETAVRE